MTLVDSGVGHGGRLEPAPVRPVERLSSFRAATVRPEPGTGSCASLPPGDAGSNGPAFDIGRWINAVWPWSGCRYKAIGPSSTAPVPPDLAIPLPLTSPTPQSTPSRRRSHRKPPGDAVPGKAPLRAGARTLTGVEGHPAATYRPRPSVHPPRRHPVCFGPGIVWSPAHGVVEDRAPHRWIPVNLPRPGGATWACVATGLGMGATNTVRRCRTPWSATGSPPAAWWPNSWVSAGCLWAFVP